MDGFETAARIRATERGREVPILFLTAIDRDETYANRGYGVGAADYITKPFDVAVVRARVKAFVELFRQRERQRRARLETALNFAPALVCIFRVSDHACEFANVAARGLLGPREVVGSSAEELGATPEMMALFDRVAATGEPLSLMEHVLTVGAVDGVFDMTLQPLRDDQGQVDAVVSFAIDVTESVRARRTLEQAQARAEQASRVKDEFLAVVSHELRTPLSSILGWAANARRRNSSSELDRALVIIERSARAQARLIDDILDVSRIVVGQLRLEIASTELAATIGVAVDSLRPATEEKGITLASRIGDLGAIDVDPERIQQVIWNVLSNAIKFTSAGVGSRSRVRGPTIESSLRSPTAERASIRRFFRICSSPSGRGTPRPRGATAAWGSVWPSRARSFTRTAGPSAPPAKARGAERRLPSSYRSTRMGQQVGALRVGQCSPPATARPMSVSMTCIFSSSTTMKTRGIS